jgi:hypothetical protein
LLLKIALFLPNAAFVLAILDIISRVNLAAFVVSQHLR